MDTTQIIGVAASFFTGIAMIPPLAKLCRDKKYKDVSMGMLVILLAGLSLWTWYGVLQNDWIIIVSNAFSLVISLTTIVLAVWYRYRKSSTVPRGWKTFHRL